MELNPTLHAIILAGGRGSRFWPMSLPSQPKQFLTIESITRTRSLIQNTFDRLLALVPPERIWVVGVEEHRQLLREQLSDVPSSHFVFEPVGRNTAASVALAARLVHEVEQDAKLLVVPADHHIVDATNWYQAVADGLQAIERDQLLVTFGIKPRWAETGYGYIQQGDAISNTVSRVASFREKPTADKAKQYLQSGDFFWNSGMFLWSSTCILEEFARHAAGILNDINRLSIEVRERDGVFLKQEEYQAIDKDSVDYAIMEKTDKAAVIATDIEWSDVGGWRAVYDLMDKDRDQLAVVANQFRHVNTSNCLVHCPGVEVILSGVENLVVAYQDGRLLVTTRDAVSEIRPVVESMLDSDANDS